MSMYLYENRLKSFTSKKRKWPNKASDGYIATPETLSKAGFYFNPSQASPDNVTCYLCHKSMEGWGPTDDPFDEHVIHAPDCPWAICRCVKRKFNDDELPFSWDNEDQLPTSKKMEEARLKTFNNWWPHEGKRGWVGTSKKMAKAGFYYAPTFESTDHVTCMYCEVGLEGWEPKDNPVHEHRRRLPSCPFFAKPPPKSKKGKAAQPRNKKERSRKATKKNNIKSVIQNNIEVIDFTTDSGCVDEQIDNAKTSEGEVNEQINDININEEIRANEEEQLNNVINEEIDNQINDKTNEEVIDELSNSISDIEEVVDGQLDIAEREFDGQVGKIINEVNDEPLDIISISDDEIDEQVEVAKTSERDIDEQVKVAKTNEMEIDEQVEVAKTSEMEIDEQVEIAKTSEREIGEPVEVAKISEREIGEPVEVAKISEREIGEPVDKDVKTNEEKIDEPSDSISINDEEVGEPVDKEVKTNENDEPSDSISINDEEIGEPVDKEVKTNEEKIDEPSDSISINDEEIDEQAYASRTTEKDIGEQVDKVKTNEEEAELFYMQKGRKEIDEQVNNFKTSEEIVNDSINEGEIPKSFNNWHETILPEAPLSRIQGIKMTDGVRELQPFMEQLNNNIITNEEEIDVYLQTEEVDEQVDDVKSTEEIDKQVNHIKSNVEKIDEQSNNFRNLTQNDTVRTKDDEEIDEQLNTYGERIVDNVKIKGKDKLETLSSDTESEVTKGNDIKSISSTIQMILDDNDPMEQLNNNIITDEEEFDVYVQTEEVDQQVDDVKSTEAIDKQVNHIKSNIEEIDEQSNNFRNLTQNGTVRTKDDEEIDEQLNTCEERIVDNVKIKGKDKLETLSSDTESEVTKGNDIKSISSTIQTILDDNDPSKDHNKKILGPSIFNNSVVFEGLRPASYIPLATHTLSFIPQQDISTNPNYEIKPPAFVTPKRKAKKVAFTVEDYLKSLTETQKMKFIERTNQKIENIIELQKRAKELIASIPII